ncbi:MAG: hypothetical protein K2X47_18590 [Bdellovibrionales bacterium]|nr:hypothetical protein [Bdellovibrionales bacterium]
MSSSEQVAATDLRANLTPSRRWAFRIIALMFVVSGLGSIPIWRILNPPSTQEALAVQSFSESYQVRCEFVGLNLWRYVAAGMPKVKSKVLCGLPALEMTEEDSAHPLGFARTVLRSRGDQFQSGFGNEDLEVSIVLVGSKETAFACFKPKAAPAWSQCQGSPEFGCPPDCDHIQLSP